MDTERARPSEDGQLTNVRNRGARFVTYILWAASGGFVLIATTAYFAAVEHWVALVEKTRHAAGLTVPHAGPDWVLLGALLAAGIFPCSVLTILYINYRSAWVRRLRQTWGPTSIRAYTQIPRLSVRASADQVRAKLDYLNALLLSPGWETQKTAIAGHLPRPVDTYPDAAAQVLSVLEHDICERAIATGLIVGASGNRAIDLLTIAGAALEMQLHVLTRLGKRPSLRIWGELWKRTAASLFLNTYLNREDAWALKLSIRKMGLGLQAIGEASDGALHSLSDVDWTEHLEDILPGDHWAAQAARTGLEALLGSGGFVLSLGANGIQQVGRIVEHCGNEVFEGVLAGGVLYYHGMAIAADCLAMDAAHRQMPEMNRSFREAVHRVCRFAGQLVRDQARDFRGALKEKRRQAFSELKSRTGNAVIAQSREAVETLGASAASAGKAAASASSQIIGKAASTAHEVGEWTSRAFNDVKSRISRDSRTEADPTATDPRTAKS
jgi:hypothetical protein